MTLVKSSGDDVREGRLGNITFRANGQWTVKATAAMGSMLCWKTIAWSQEKALQSLRFAKRGLLVPPMPEIIHQHGNC